MSNWLRENILGTDVIVVYWKRRQVIMFAVLEKYRPVIDYWLKN